MKRIALCLFVAMALTLTFLATADTSTPPSTDSSKPQDYCDHYKTPSPCNIGYDQEYWIVVGQTQDFDISYTIGSTLWTWTCDKDGHNHNDKNVSHAPSNPFLPPPGANFGWLWEQLMLGGNGLSKSYTYTGTAVGTDTLVFSLQCDECGDGSSTGGDDDPIIASTGSGEEGESGSSEEPSSSTSLTATVIIHVLPVGFPTTHIEVDVLGHQAKNFGSNGLEVPEEDDDIPKEIPEGFYYHEEDPLALLIPVNHDYDETSDFSDADSVKRDWELHEETKTVTEADDDLVKLIISCQGGEGDVRIAVGGNHKLYDSSGTLYTEKVIPNSELPKELWMETWFSPEESEEEPSAEPKEPETAEMDVTVTYIPAPLEVPDATSKMKDKLLLTAIEPLLHAYKITEENTEEFLVTSDNANTQMVPHVLAEIGSNLIFKAPLTPGKPVEENGGTQPPVQPPIGIASLSNTDGVTSAVDSTGYEQSAESQPHNAWPHNEVTLTWGTATKKDSPGNHATYTIEDTAFHTVIITGKCGKKGEDLKRKVHIGLIDLDVDTDRDADITDDDEDKEDEWTKERGAFFMVNCDDDDGQGDSDAGGFVTVGNTTTFKENYVIDKEGDVDDIAPLNIRLAKDVLKNNENYKVFLKFANEADSKRAHIFKEIKEGEERILGDASKTSVLEKDITDIVKAKSECKFGIEGLFFKYVGEKIVESCRFDGEVKLIVEVRDGSGIVVASDKVCLHIAPWLMLSREQAAEEIWAGRDTYNTPILNENFFGTGKDEGLKVSGVVEEYATTKGVTYKGNSQWAQDHAEIGYTQFPGGPKTHVVFSLNHWKQDWVKYDFAFNWDPKIKSLGFFQLGERAIRGDGSTGGNLEILPPDTTNKLGRIVVGNNASDELKNFLISQGYQSPITTVDPSWLDVGHIDEFSSFLPDGEVVIADPKMAWALIEDPDKIPVSKRHESVFFVKKYSGNAWDPVPQSIGGTVGGASTTRLYDGPATGTITIVDPINISDGMTVTFGGLTFEFDKDGNVVSDVKVDIADTKNADGTLTPLKAKEISTALVTAIHDVFESDDYFYVDAYLDSNGVINLWNKMKGAGGNQPITSSPTTSNFTHPAKMAGGKDDGRDFTQSSHNLIRTFSYDSNNKPVNGQTAVIKSKHDGWLEIRTVWPTGSKVQRFNNLQIPNWKSKPKFKDKYVLCDDAKYWYTKGFVPTPALITVEEVLADDDFRKLNNILVPAAINLMKAELGTFTYKSVPSLFTGTPLTDSPYVEDAQPFNPGPANLQPLNGTYFVSKQFGPLDNTGKDILAESIKDALKATTIFVDDWDFYHRAKGGVHCGSNVKRELPTYNWWEEAK